MKLMVVGGGGREHALIRNARKTNPEVEKITPCRATAASRRTRSA